MDNKRHILRIANCLLWTGIILSVWGNAELLGGHNVFIIAIVGAASLLLSLGMMACIEIAAQHPGMRTIYLCAAAFCCFLEVFGQYAHLLSNANERAEENASAVATVATGADDQSSLRQELVTVQAALAREQGSGWGPKAQALAARVDAIRAKLDAVAGRTDEAQQVHAKRPPLFVVCERFGWDVDQAQSIVTGAFVLGLMLIGMMLKFSAHLPEPVVKSVETTVIPPVAPVPQPKPKFLGPWPAAPEWLDVSRRNIQDRCAPSELDVTLGRRAPLN